MENLDLDIFPQLPAHPSDLAPEQWLMYVLSSDGNLYLKVSSEAPKLFSQILETEQTSIENENNTESDRFVSVRRFWQGLSSFLQKAWTWTGLQTFANILVKQIFTSKQSLILSGADPSQAINLNQGSYVQLDLSNASGIATVSFTNPQVGASYWVVVLQAATAVDISLVNVGRYDGETGNTIEGEDAQNYDLFLVYTGAGFKFSKMNVT